MRGMRKSLVLLALYLLIVFNLDRLLLLQGDGQTIHFFVYWLVVLALASYLFIPDLHNRAVYWGLAIWSGTYVALRLAFFRNDPLFVGNALFQTITEITVVTLAVLLSYEVTRNLNVMEDLVEKVTFGALSQRVLDMQSAEDEIKTEMIRSRRHERPLTVLVLEPAPNALDANLQRAVQEVQRAITRRYVLGSLARAISDEARRTDLVVRRDDKGRFIVLCPETTPEGSVVLADRIRANIAEQLGIPVAYGIATFPDEALSFDELLRKAESDLMNPVKNPALFYAGETPH
ncbi:MAG: diguanylate cyclase [Anaerolineae bacterium]|nr:MAG: diguanylate cyclase [Anaerolineae bacterium]